MVYNNKNKYKTISMKIYIIGVYVSYTKMYNDYHYF